VPAHMSGYGAVFFVTKNTPVLLVGIMIMH